MGLTAPEGRITAKRLEFSGVDLLHCPPKQRRALRGGRLFLAGASLPAGVDVIVGGTIDESGSVTGVDGTIVSHGALRSSSSSSPSSSSSAVLTRGKDRP